MAPVARETDIVRLLSAYDRARQNLIPILQDVQEQLGFLSQDAVGAIAEHLQISENDLFGVATFFTQFRFTPPGRHCIKVCQGTACHVRGSGLIMEELSQKLGIHAGETTSDREFSLERVACFGSCALAPVVVIDDKVHGLLTPKSADELVDEMGSRRDETVSEA
ncbi:MAG: NADH-quinone oxidoreductase subunit NuoE [Acidobacteriota bacterium]|nr:MAG: NADH-quinone oxidoreductase subunit NuoE [Acidobacteriota bacterium]